MRRVKVTKCDLKERATFKIFALHLYLNVAKARGLQSQGVKGEVVVVYFEPLTTQNLKSSGFPGG